MHLHPPRRGNLHHRVTPLATTHTLHAQVMAKHTLALDGARQAIAAAKTVADDGLAFSPDECFLYVDNGVRPTEGRPPRRRDTEEGHTEEKPPAGKIRSRQLTPEGTPLQQMWGP
ncbi:MAG TPA: hypothetical protein VKA84_25110 [Gemmatimonadaceae bacterium]|nr:hypothetical protein [Gemmatimonadaceae bacterium]